jgi:hypothetical protein
MTEVPRDHQDRPLIAVPDQKKLVAHTRTSKYAQTLSDSYSLAVHQMKEVAIGLAEHQELIPQIIKARKQPEVDKWNGLVRTDYYDHRQMLRIIHEAKAFAGSEVKSGHGTKMHSLTETVDKGEDMAWDLLSPMESADLMAWTYWTEELEFPDIERFCVNQDIGCAGTLDRTVMLWGKKRIADIKTGKLKPLEMAMQLALYARSETYECMHPIAEEPNKDICANNIGEHQYGDLGVELDWGVLLHLPAREGHLAAYKVDINEGWGYVRLAQRVRAARLDKGLLTPLDFEVEPIPF